jgi:hypothetical protein
MRHKGIDVRIHDVPLAHKRLPVDFYVGGVKAFKFLSAP